MIEIIGRADGTAAIERFLERVPDGPAGLAQLTVLTALSRSGPPSPGRGA